MLRFILFLTLSTVGAAFSQDTLNLDLPLLDQQVTEHFTFSYYAILTPKLRTLTDEADDVFTYVSERMDRPYHGRIEVALRPLSDEPCPARGVMFTRADNGETRSIIVFVDETTPLAQLRAVLAHELAHFLHAGGFAKFPSSAGLTEGLASWAAGRYWLVWQASPSFASSVATYLEQGSYLPLENGLESGGAYGGDDADCLRRRDTLYTEWAAFTDYLITTNGVNRFKALLGTADVALDEAGGTPPDFVRIYGRSLEELEKAWLDQVGAQ